MSTELPMDSLQARHAELEDRLSQELNRPMPDQSVIAALKKQKLRIKDELEGHSTH